MPNFQSIPKYIQDGSYQVNCDLENLDVNIRRYETEYGLQICPDFQRGRVWTEAQQIAYVEHLLRGGKGSELIRFNHPGWFRSFKGDMVLVDGLQRLTAALRFVWNDLPVFGHYREEWTGWIPIQVGFLFMVNDLRTRAEVLQWYLEINEGGTPHTEAELDRVRGLLEAERK